jgi:mono/diheme cytochrome c family protein
LSGNNPFVSGSERWRLGDRLDIDLWPSVYRVTELLDDSELISVGTQRPLGYLLGCEADGPQNILRPVGFAWNMPMTGRRLIIAIVAVVAVVAVIGVLLVWKPAIGPIDPPKTATFNSGLVTKGAELAAIGNCVVCHTSPGGKAYAGSRALPTPFGTIYSSNITPDTETGIGRWSEEAFRRALRDGVDREGHHLYPAFPYDHFTHLTDDDIRALYAFVMTRDAVVSRPPENKLPFPFNIRPLLAGWKLLFLSRGPREGDGAHSAEWNRGAYLAEGVAHCGACHTPRNFLGAEEKSRAYVGGEAEGWDAPALNIASTAPVSWTTDQLFTYLRTGWQAQHGASAGPMAPVTENMARVPDNDVRAIATYIASLSKDRAATPSPSRSADATSAAATIYAGACAVCHDRPAGAASQGLPLSMSSSLNEPRPRNTLNVILRGIVRRPGDSGPFMPAFDSTLTDAQIADLAAYIRSRFSSAPAWNNIGDALREIRKGDPS